MAAVTTAPDAAPGGTGAPPGELPPVRRRRGRFSAGHVVMLLAALVAGLLNYSLLRARDESVLVAVAAIELPAGRPVAASAFRAASVRVDPALLATLVQPADLADLDGWVPVATIPAGELVSRRDLRAPSAPAAHRAMSIPVDPAHAVGGSLVPGDRIDVIVVRDGVASYVTNGAEVLAVSAAEAGLVGTGFSVTIAVDDATALELAAALRADSIELVRSTGAAASTAGPFDPRAGQAGPSGAGEPATEAPADSPNEVPNEDPDEDPDDEAQARSADQGAAP